MSARNPAFNPFAYQRGAVWPHDNALIAAGRSLRLRRGGREDHPRHPNLDAASMFQGYRLPELFSGHGGKHWGSRCSTWESISGRRGRREAAF